MADAKHSPGSHIAVFPFPSVGHTRPMMNLVHMIAVADLDIMVSFFRTANFSDDVILDDFEGIDNIKVYDLRVMVPENCEFPDGMDAFFEAAPENFRSGVEAVVAERGRKITCLISDTFLFVVAKMAEEMGVPWVTLWPAAPCSLAAHVYTDTIRDLIGTEGIIGRDDEILEFIPGMPALRIKDIAQEITVANLKSKMPSLLYEMGRIVQHATGVVINSFEELNPIVTNNLKSKFQKFLNIGFFNVSSSLPSDFDQHECLSWLDKQEPLSVTYISFGSIAVLPLEEVVGLAEALESRATPFLWSIRGDLKDHMLQGFIERTKAYGKVVSWAPQCHVLAHSSIRVFVTHCG